MKKSELRKIIKEEIKSTLNEGIGAPGLGSGVLDTGGMSGHQGSGISDGDKMMQRLHGKNKRKSCFYKLIIRGGQMILSKGQSELNVGLIRDGN